MGVRHDVLDAYPLVPPTDQTSPPGSGRPRAPVEVTSHLQVSLIEGVEIDGPEIDRCSAK